MKWMGGRRDGQMDQQSTDRWIDEWKMGKWIDCHIIIIGM